MYKVDFGKKSYKTGTLRESAKAPKTAKSSKSKPGIANTAKTTKSKVKIPKTTKTTTKKASVKKATTRKKYDPEFLMSVKADRARRIEANRYERELKKDIREAEKDYRRAVREYNKQLREEKQAEIEAKRAAREAAKQEQRANRDFEKIAYNKAKAAYRAETSADPRRITDKDIRAQQAHMIAEAINKYYYSARPQDPWEAATFGINDTRAQVRDLVASYGYDMTGLEESDKKSRVRTMEKNIEQLMDTQDLSKLFVEMTDIGIDTEYKRSGYQKNVLDMIKHRILNSTEVSKDVKELVRIGGYQAVVDYINYRTLQKSLIEDMSHYKYSDTDENFWTHAANNYKELKDSKIVSGKDKDAENFAKYRLQQMSFSSPEILKREVNSFLDKVKKYTTLDIEYYRL